ncbi:MAG TPA: MASE1 domain-containing protein [Burkholderiales bacterium]|nr:MASE1 domain-containing protein [Burkholderiales bacterium]
MLAALGYYAGAKLGLALTFSPHPISVLWPPNSILLAALLLAPASSWWMILLAVFPVHLLAELQGGVPLVMVLCWFVSNASEALIGAAGVRILLKEPPAFDTMRNAGIFLLFAVLLAPFLSSFLDAAFVSFIGWGESGYWQLWRTRFFSNILATLTIVPVILTWVSIDAKALRTAGPVRIGESAVLLFGLLAVGVVVFDAHPVGVVPALLYLPLPFLLWAALRFGPAGSSAAFMIFAFLVIWGAGHGRGPFVTGNPVDNALSVQLFLAFVGTTLLVLVAGVQEARNSERRLRSSEERFATAFRFSPDAMVITRKSDGRLIDVNDRCLTMFDYRREDVVGRTVQELDLYLEPRDRERLLASTSEPGAVRDFDLAFRTRKGEVLNTIVKTEAVEMGGIPCLVTIIHDVTKLKRTEESLRRNDERFQHVLRATNDVVYDWDVVADSLWWNGNGDAYFGKMSENGPCTRARWAAALHPEDRERVTSRLDAMLKAGGGVSDTEYRLRRVDGNYAHVHGRGFVVRDASGRPLRMIGSLMDITDRKRAEDANQRLAHVSRLAVLGELTASIAHEINQPLGAILSNADAAEILLDSEVVPVDELRQIVKDIRKDDIRAGEVIRHMRSLTRRRNLSMQPFDLNRAIDDVIRLVNVDLGRHRVAVDAEFAPLPIVYGDQVHVQQVVLNLILNGVDAMADTPAARRRLRITTARCESGGVEVSVTDSGPGIAHDQAEDLFASFYTTKPDGVGLGLSIARSIVEAHGGAIWAETRPEGGARFSFVLPGQSARTGAGGAAA